MRRTIGGVSPIPPSIVDSPEPPEADYLSRPFRRAPWQLCPIRVPPPRSPRRRSEHKPGDTAESVAASTAGKNGTGYPID